MHYGCVNVHSLTGSFDKNMTGSMTSPPLGKSFCIYTLVQCSIVHVSLPLRVLLVLVGPEFGNSNSPANESLGQLAKT